MNVLVIGSGGREHAIVKALSQSKKIGDLYAHPGSAAIFEWAKPLSKSLLSMDPNTVDLVVDYCLQEEIKLVVIGPEAPLVWGLSDKLRDKNILVFGPDAKAALLEGDKLFAKKFMTEFKVPTGHYEEVSNLESLNKALDKFSKPYVFKYRDLAGGKGVLVSSDEKEILEFAKSYGVTEDQENTVGYLEEALKGWELSFICVMSEKGYSVCPILQDHKRLLDNDEGPNTGGMGVAGPIEIDQNLYNKIITQIVEPTLAGIKKRGVLYRGALYFGVMVTEAGPKLLEYNVRFGDPEAQLIFSLIEKDWGDIFIKTAQGDLPMSFKASGFGCCVVLAAKGYPKSPEKGAKIFGLESLKAQDVFHAGTDFKDEHFYVSGGRVLNILGKGDALSEAVSKAYQNLNSVNFEGMQFRRDIGKKL